MIESKPVWKIRVSQGIIDLVTYHLTTESASDKKIICLVSHHNAIHEFMRIFGRQEHVEKKPIYCWTGVVEIELDLSEVDE